MEWATLAALIVQHGLPVALKLAEKWGSKEPVTPAEIEELRALSLRTPQSQMRDALARAGVDLNSDKAKELLGLVGG